jgi:TRAP-type mannitol/chloroaromatic compound transport system permease small subunit
MENMPGKTQFFSKLKRELVIFLICFAASFCLHVYSHLKIDLQLSGIFSQIQNVLFIALAIYFLLLTFRLLFYGISKITKR